MWLYSIVISYNYIDYKVTGGRVNDVVITIAGASKVHKKGNEETLIKNLIGDRLVPNKEAHKSLITMSKCNIWQVVL